MNAKKELLALLENYGVELKCGYLEDIYYGNDKHTKWILKINYSKEDLEQFLAEIDFKYDDGYGSEQLGGILWFVDGTWADRGEYDGSEWWEVHKLPEIPPELKEND